MEHLGSVADLGAGSVRKRLAFQDESGGLSIFGHAGALPHKRKIHGKCRQKLSCAVMKVTGNPPSFFILHVQDMSGELVEFVLGALAVGNIPRDLGKPSQDAVPTPHGG